MTNLYVLVPTKYTFSYGNNQLIPFIVDPVLNQLRSYKILVPFTGGQQPQQGGPYLPHIPYIKTWSIGPCHANEVLMRINTPLGVLETTGNFSAATQFRMEMQFPHLRLPLYYNNVFSGNFQWDLSKWSIFRTDFRGNNQQLDVTGIFNQTVYENQSLKADFGVSIPFNHYSPRTAQISVQGSFDFFKKSDKNQQLCAQKEELVGVDNSPIAKDQSNPCDAKINLSEQLLSKRNFDIKSISLGLYKISANVIRDDLFIVALSLTFIKVVALHLIISEKNKNEIKKGAENKTKEKLFFIIKIPSLEKLEKIVQFCTNYSTPMMVYVFFSFSKSLTDFSIIKISNLIKAAPSLYSAGCFICRFPVFKAFLIVYNVATVYSGALLIATIVLTLFEFVATTGIDLVIELVNPEKDLIDKVEEKSEKKALLRSQDFIDISLNHVISNF